MYSSVSSFKLYSDNRDFFHFLYLYLYMYIFVYVGMFVWVNLYVCICICVCAFVYACINVRMWVYVYIQSKLDNSTLTGRSFHVELASMLSYRMYKLMT